MGIIDVLNASVRELRRHNDVLKPPTLLATRRGAAKPRSRKPPFAAAARAGCADVDGRDSVARVCDCGAVGRKEAPGPPDAMCAWRH
jgi:hypothetical protein